MKRVLENVIKRALGELNNIFQNEFNTILSQQSTIISFFLSNNWIQRIKLKNKGPKQTNLATFWNFRVKWRHDVNIWNSAIYDVMKSYLTRVWDKKIRHGYFTLETRYVMW